VARAAHPQAMQASRPSSTRTAPPMMPPKFPMAGRYRSYILFGACSLAFVLASLTLLRMVWALGSGPDAWAGVLEDFRNPIYVLYHLVALLAFVYTGWRFFIVLFAKSQPPRVGPLRSPPRAAFPPMLVAAWVAASAAVILVAWGIVP
jgi:fumarate reductase subunit C